MVTSSTINHADIEYNDTQAIKEETDVRYTRLLSIITPMLLMIVSPIYAKTTYVTHLGDQEVFISQYGTGTYALYNCAPASLAMIRTWRGDEIQNVEGIRQNISNKEEWMYTDEVEDYPTKENINYNRQDIWDQESLVEYLDTGMLLMCVDISKVARSQDPDSLIGRTSSIGTGHFLVASGYYQQDANLYIQVLDPLNTGIRYYPAEELFEAAQNWWQYTFVIKDIQ